MKRLGVLIAAVLVGMGAFFLVRPAAMDYLCGENRRKIDGYNPQFMHHLAVAKQFLEDPRALAQFEVEGGTAYTQHNPYPRPAATLTLDEEPRAALARLEGKVIFLPRAVPDYDQSLNRFMGERLLPGQTGDGVLAAGKLPAGKVVVLDPEASRECATALDQCGYYLAHPTSGPAQLPAGETPRPVVELAQQVNLHRNQIEAADAVALRFAAACGTLVAVAVAAGGLLLARKRRGRSWIGGSGIGG
jgi:hypothetical protein